MSRSFRLCAYSTSAVSFCAKKGLPYPPHVVMSSSFRVGHHWWGDDEVDQRLEVEEEAVAESGHGGEAGLLL